MLANMHNTHICQKRNGPLHRTWQRPLDHWRSEHWNSVEKTHPHPAFYHAQQCYVVFLSQRDQPPGEFKPLERPFWIACKKRFAKFKDSKEVVLASVLDP